VPALNYWNRVIGLNETFLAEINARADACGFTDFFNEYSNAFPPTGPFRSAPDPSAPGCDLYDDILSAVYYVNPCFNIYHLIDYCPYLSDEMGFPSLGGGPNNYFNRSDVQAQLHIEPTDYSVCGNNPFRHGNNTGDNSIASGLGPLPSVIERTNNVLIGHGLLDFLLFSNGSLITIQNMTWNGAQGFQTRPPSEREQNFYAPYHPGLAEVGDGEATFGFSDVAGAGLVGTYHTERGLTWSTVTLAGHEIPQYAPGAAFRHLEFLLGRIPNLGTVGSFTTQPGNFTGTTPLLKREEVEYQGSVRRLRH
jgi:carboxypeptidase D